jgi:hypothetical protein
MTHLLRPRIWTPFLASSGVGPCDVPFRYASEPIPRYRGTVARWHAHLRGLGTAIDEISGLADFQQGQRRQQVASKLARAVLAGPGSI